MDFMFKKSKFEDEKRGLPEIAKLIIFVSAIALMFFVADKLTDYAFKKDMETQTEYVIGE